MLVCVEEECAVVWKSRRELDHLELAVPEIHHGWVRGNEIRPPHPEARGPDAAPDLEPVARQSGITRSTESSELAAVKLCLKLGASVNVANKYGDTARMAPPGGNERTRSFSYWSRRAPI